MNMSLDARDVTHRQWWGGKWQMAGRLSTGMAIPQHKLPPGIVGEGITARTNKWGADHDLT